ncbi:MAG: GNAT family N-acetyltransferase [Pseudonocardiaceae bacterium]
MRFRPDWLRRVLRVPYVPTLGPVHPETLSIELFDDVLVASQTGQLLPFDKNRRWWDRQHDSVLVAEIIHRPDQTIIPVLSHRGGGTLKTYYYGTTNPDRHTLGVATRRWCRAYGARAGRVIWFDPDSPAPGASACTRVLLKVFGDDPPSPQPAPAQVADLEACPAVVRASFTGFAQQLHATGFGFLHRRWRAGQLDGPILVTLANQVIVGAIGPLRTLPGPRGHLVLLPQYFAVLPGHRGRGHGRALWRAATTWAKHHHAAYQLLQTETGQASERFFLSEDLTCLGFTCAVIA